MGVNDSLASHNQYGYGLPEAQGNNNSDNNNNQGNNNDGGNVKQRIGLMPTSMDQDVYKRSNSRSSRRSRAERTSYLVATGHLNIEETEQLTKAPNEFDSTNNDQIDSNVGTTNSHKKQQQQLPSSNYRQRPGPSSLVGNHSFLDYVTVESSNLDTIQDNIVAQNNSFKKSPKGLKVVVDNNSRSFRGAGGKKGHKPKFEQTFTEVTLPMKTSPAFEYILKDNRRRNRRCCLWLIYSLLVTICLAVLIFCSVHLTIRYYH